MKEYNQCVACLGKDITIEDRDSRVDVPFAGYIVYRTKVARCNNCQTEIRIDSDSQEEVEKQIYEASVNSIPELLKDLNRRGFSDDRIDRALYLKSGTVKQWKEGKNIDPVVIALVRFLYMLPQLIVVAEEQYDVTKLFRI